MKTEKEIMAYFDEKFGANLYERRRKLEEEIDEVVDAEYNYYYNVSEDAKDKLIDEVSDVLAVASHLGHCLGYTSDQLLNMAYDKCKIRETNPEYKHG